MTLPVSVLPHGDEHLPGLVVRAGNLMGYDLTSDVLIPLGYKSRAESIASAPGLKFPLADHLGCRVEDISPLFLDQAGRSGWLRFFGAEIRAIHREVTVRRIAPGTLATCGYHKAAWQIRAFGFDPATGERLISECPVCGTTLGWVRVRDLAFCDRCDRVDDHGFVRSKVDLRDWPQEKVEVEDMEALRFVTSLVDPDPAVRAAYAPALHPDIETDRGSLFEFAISIASAMTQDPKRSVTSVAKPGSREMFDRIEPDVLAKAGRVVLSWPDGFHDLCSQARDSASERSGHYGVKKEIGSLYALTTDRALPPELRAAVRKSVEDDMAMTAVSLPTVRKGSYRNRSDLLTAYEAAKEFGIRPKLFKILAGHPEVRVIRNAGSKNSPMLFERAQIAMIAAQRADMEAASSAAVRLGLPTGAMAELAEAGLVDTVGGPVLMLAVGKEYYTRSSVNRLVDRLESKVLPAVPPSTYIRLTKAVYRLPPGPKPWAGIIARVIDGTIPVHRIDGRLTGTMTSLAAPDFETVVAAVGRHAGSDEARDGLLTHIEASVLLGVTEPMIGRLVLRRLLPVKAKGQVSIARADVFAVARKWMFTNEASRRLGVPNRLVRTTLAKFGVHPKHELRERQQLVFAREEVERVLETVVSTAA